MSLLRYPWFSIHLQSWIYIQRNHSPTKLKSKSIAVTRLLDLALPNAQADIWKDYNVNQRKIFALKTLTSSLPTLRTMQIREPNIYLDPTCPSCLCNMEDACHVLWECDILADRRNALIAKHKHSDDYTKAGPLELEKPM